jgi:hypothetical protein
MKFLTSSISLIFVNLVPLFGAIFLGWDLTTLLIIYWTENIAIGFWNILKLLKAPRVNDKNNKYHFSIEDSSKEQIERINNPANIGITRLFFAMFFFVHYGIFTIVHGAFILTIGIQTSNDFLMYLPGVLFTFLLIFISHGISYFTNYIGNKEYENTSLAELMIKPYKRIFITHFVVFIVFILLKDSGNSILPAIILIVVKTIGDLIFHNIEHSKPSNK